VAEDTNRVEFMMQLRDQLFQELEEAEREYTRVRLVVERMESDQRVGLAEPPDYQETKGRLLPRVEGRVLDLFRDLLKLEDKIIARRSQGA
jgi:hypothetical protein